MARALPLTPDERRTTLLAAARAVFGRQGYHQASVADVITEAGVARGTFYNHFESKRAVFHAVLEDLMDEVVAAVLPIAVDAPIAPQVRDNFVRLIRAACDRDVVRLLFAEAVGIDDESDTLLREFYARALGRIQAALELGAALGWVRPGDQALAARCLLGLVKEPLFQAALSREPVDAEALADAVFALLSAGLLLPPPSR